MSTYFLDQLAELREALRGWARSGPPSTPLEAMGNDPRYSYGDNWISGYEAAMVDILVMLGPPSIYETSYEPGPGETADDVQRRHIAELRRMNPNKDILRQLKTLERALDKKATT